MGKGMTGMAKGALIGVLALAGWPSAAASEDYEALKVRAREMVAACSGFTPAATEDLVAVIDEAGKAGLPAGYLVNRVREGVSRGADAGTILAVVRARLNWLVQAELMLAGGPRDGEAAMTAARIAVCEALAGKVPPGVIEGITASARRGTRGPGEVAASVDALTTLVRAGISPRESGIVICAALESKIEGKRIPPTAMLMAEARLDNIPAAEARAIIVAGLEAGWGSAKMASSLKAAARGRNAERGGARIGREGLREEIGGGRRPGGKKDGARGGRDDGGKGEAQGR